MARGHSVYQLSVMLPWLAISNTLAHTATGFVEKKNVLSKRGLPLAVLPIFIVVAETATFGIGLLLFGVFLSFTQQAQGAVFWPCPGFFGSKFWLWA